MPFAGGCGVIAQPAARPRDPPCPGDGEQHPLTPSVQEGKQSPGVSLGEAAPAEGGSLPGVGFWFKMAGFCSEKEEEGLEMLHP